MSQCPFIFPLGHNFWVGHFQKSSSIVPTCLQHAGSVTHRTNSWIWDIYYSPKFSKNFEKIMSQMSHTRNLAQKVGTFRDIFFPIYVRRYNFYPYRIKKVILGHFFGHLGHFFRAFRAFFALI